MTKHKQLLQEALEIQEQRAQHYGPFEQAIESIANLSSEITGKNITPWDVCMMHVSTKLRRLATTKDHRDSYVDLMNYVAFAYTFAEKEK